MRTLAAAVLGGFFMSGQAVAQGLICTSSVASVERLATTDGAVRIGEGLSMNGSAFALYLAPNGHWSMWRAAPEGLICMVVQGSDWQALAAPVPGQDG